MTVLEKIIRQVRATKTNLLSPEEIVFIIQSFKEAEEQQIRDAYKAGGKNEYGHAYIKNPHPDLETYIQQVKQHLSTGKKEQSMKLIGGVYKKCSGEVVVNFNIKNNKKWQKTAASKNLQT